ncbi:hypothetical protein ABT337_17270 [Saccharopolyspora hirsuta]|uniref:Uncharacterized protein n=1 Tax=Saccharopolyspora hirsuta TaxID=1837 RepID=A0A5M7BGD8_SACHI|nr:hypothetical protein [Saccharopolyspora hirsuta]KAA5826491.1 hypothetical protein F1721_30810 [Saccharopolyspora hirsuta]
MVVQRLQAVALLLGPVVFAISPFFWIDGHYGVTGGALIALSAVPWVYGLIGEYERLRERLPTLAGLWLLLLLIGMFGSIAFGLQGFFEGVFGITGRASLAAFEDYPPHSLFVLLLPGPGFPLALLAFGAMLGWTRLAPRWVSVLICLAAIFFPLARVLRVDWIAYLADLLMVVAFGLLAWRAWQRRDLPGGAAAA